MSANESVERKRERSSTPISRAMIDGALSGKGGRGNKELRCPRVTVWKKEVVRDHG